AAPVALARNAPVAQAEIDLAHADRTIAARFVLEPARDLFLRLLDGHAVEEARIDHAPLAVIGGVGDDEGARVLSRRGHPQDIAQPRLVCRVEGALGLPPAAH